MSSLLCSIYNFCQRIIFTGPTETSHMAFIQGPQTWVVGVDRFIPFRPDPTLNKLRWSPISEGIPEMEVEITSIIFNFFLLQFSVCNFYTFDSTQQIDRWATEPKRTTTWDLLACENFFISSNICQLGIYLIASIFFFKIHPNILHYYIKKNITN